jgi:hypothetical protein
VNWDAASDAMLVRLWGEGRSMEAVAEAMRGLGYPVPAGRNAIAGRLNRLRSMSIKMPDRPPAEPKPKAKRVRLSKVSKVSKPKPPRAKGITHDNGVDYLSNHDGCKAILDTRSGRYNLRKCCGKSREAETPYCSGHLRLFQNPGVRKPHG